MQADVTLDWDVYLLAGVGSSRTIFAECVKELQHRYAEAGKASSIRELFPYGDHTHNFFQQLLKVRKDLYRFRRAVQFGARAVAGQVRKQSAGKPVLFIGHSGGGVAAYQAAVMLHKEGVIPDWRVVQVGSPKMPIAADYISKVHYVVAVNEKGACADLITRLGSWGGISRNRYGMWYWNRAKYAPKHIIPLPLIGGHQHYFRKEAPYIHPERGSNLVVMIDVIWERVARELALAASSLM
ncbi:hypothetical protein [Paenibacillus sp. CF384]|uniref:hypothetical protein n=1 Tax=Paenibacillus sp. CF384 TaxID=1884382 RepID=UPI0008953181|nr:hypothetical protein [Paenibacillus sp. CF384]SDW13458.1 hypothetical protein SAMN05518855_1001372 [Paenibacillus sp. CF384]